MTDDEKFLADLKAVLDKMVATTDRLAQDLHNLFADARKRCLGSVDNVLKGLDPPRPPTQH
jgi:hypothetical protein